MKTLLIAAAAVTLTVSAATGASAQAMGGVAPGAGDGARSASNSREENANYNRVIAGMKPMKMGRAVPASPSDVTAGSILRDINGVAVGLVESLEGDGAIVSTSAGRVRVPLIGFGKDKAGLMLSMTAAELDAAVKAANGG